MVNHDNNDDDKEGYERSVDDTREWYGDCGEYQLCRHDDDDDDDKMMTTNTKEVTNCG